MRFAEILENPLLKYLESITALISIKWLVEIR